MTPGARIAAAIEVLEKIEKSYSPADKVISHYYRSRRYIGSKDRREISSRVFKILRHHARLLWWTNGGLPRLRTIASLALLDRIPKEEIRNLFDGSGYAPPPLSPYELERINHLSDQMINDEAMPDWLSGEVPAWLSGELKSNWTIDFDREAKALNQPAPLDLRVNTLKSTSAKAIEILKFDGIKATPTPFSPIGLRIHERVNIYNTSAFKRGSVDIQDEGSQLVSLLVDARTDQKTIDFCAGGGGKTLALAATMKDGGPLIACETDASRLNKMNRRLKRAGASNITRKTLDGLDDPWIEGSAGSACRVLLDTPCSGSGAWRRSPAAKWRLTPDELARQLKRQALILEAGAKLVAPGGRLIYTTCSVLRKENEGQIEQFLENDGNFEVLPIPQVWTSVIGSDCPSAGPFLNLTPARHGTDGFFCAVLERAA